MAGSPVEPGTDLHHFPKGGASAPPFFASRSLRTLNTCLLSGIPRAGTSLCCRLAGDLPNVVALSEPLNGPALAQPHDAQAASASIAAFTDVTRTRILAERRAPTVHVAGRLHDDMVSPPKDAAALRQRQGQRGDLPIDKPLTADFTLVVKQNALFAALLPALRPRFACLAVVRNPLPVLASWQTVRLPVQRGRLPAGERFDAALGARLDAEPGVLRRQIAILNWFFAQYRAHLPAAAILRYEDVVATGGQALFRHLGAAGPRLPLAPRAAPICAAQVAALLAALLASDGAWRLFYGPCDLQAAADALRRQAAETGRAP